jgi:NAD(P)-dependent dehydrogenase (short-subunit alcohol dehydrogenase family)
MTQWKYESTGDEVVAAFKDSVQGKTIVITGPSKGGIGAETAVSLAKASPALLILAGRSESKAAAVISQITEISSDVNVQFINVDLGSQKSVRKAAAEINAITTKIDLLINNAAIMACPYAKTEDGIESQFGTNHIGHFLLTALLVDKILAAGAGSRIINVSSSAIQGTIRYDDYNFQDGAAYNPWLGYGQAKISNVVFSRALARKLKSRGIFSFSLHPGSIRSGLQVHMNSAPGGREAAIAKAKAATEKAGNEFVLESEKTLQQGCATTLVAALDPSIEPQSGSYLWNSDVRDEQPWTAEEDQEKLWALSERLTGVKFDL